MDPTSDGLSHMGSILASHRVLGQELTLRYVSCVGHFRSRIYNSRPRFCFYQPVEHEESPSQRTRLVGLDSELLHPKYPALGVRL